MMDKESFKQLAEEIISKGFDKATAYKFAGLIGDTPLVDDTGAIVVIDDEKELARIKLDFFSNKS